MNIYQVARTALELAATSGVELPDVPVTPMVARSLGIWLSVLRGHFRYQEIVTACDSTFFCPYKPTHFGDPTRVGKGDLSN